MQGRVGEFFIQHCAPFGTHSSEGSSGEVLSCSVDIWKCQGVGPTSKWCNDLTVFHYPIGGDGSIRDPFTYLYDREKALSLISPLCIPWHPLQNKGQDFLPLFTYVGFFWDIPSRSVCLPEEKHLKYLNLTRTFLAAHSGSSNKCSLETLLKLQGIFIHISFIYTLGPSYIAPLSHFTSSFKGVLKREHYPPASVVRVVEWWKLQLMAENVSCQLCAHAPITDIIIHVNTSSSWGIGLLIDGKWAAWSVHQGWRGPGRDIGWLEGVAVELVVYALDELGFHDCCVRVFSDNVGVIGAFDKGHSRKFEVNLSIRRTATIMASP